MQALYNQLNVKHYVPALVLESSLKTLSPREERVIRLTYGQRATDRDIRAYCADISQERLQQIRDKALRKLAHRSRLGPYIDGSN